MALRIEDYPLLDILHTAAPVGREGSIHFSCLTRFDSAVGIAGDLGLLAKQIAPDYATLGSTMGWLSHLALINVAVAMRRSGSRW